LTNIPPEGSGSSFLPEGHRRDLPRTALRDLGSTWRSRELPLAAEESHDPEAGHPSRDDLGSQHAGPVRRSHPVPEHRASAAEPRPSVPRRPRCSTASRRCSGRHGGISARAGGLIGLIASFFTIIYAYGRNTYSLSRAGYFPQSLSITHPTRNTPYVALIAGAVVGYVLALLIYFLGQSQNALAGKIVGALLYMACSAPWISYFMQCTAFIMLRRRLPNIERPYRSPVGVWGAAIAGAIALVALVSLFLNEDYRPGVYGTLIYFVAGLLYFAIAGGKSWCCRRRRNSRSRRAVRRELGKGGLRRDVRDRDHGRGHPDSLAVS
jgi:ethanolamine permease